MANGLLVVAFDPPPIPVRNFDWHAYIDPEGVTGYGSTELEAVQDLALKLYDESEVVYARTPEERAADYREWQQELDRDCEGLE